MADFWQQVVAQRTQELYESDEYADKAEELLGFQEKLTEGAFRGRFRPFLAVFGIVSRVSGAFWGRGLGGERAREGVSHLERDPEAQKRLRAYRPWHRVDVEVCKHLQERDAPGEDASWLYRLIIEKIRKASNI